MGTGLAGIPRYLFCAGERGLVVIRKTANRSRRALLRLGKKRAQLAGTRLSGVNCISICRLPRRIEYIVAKLPQGRRVKRLRI